jgi:hypothetical protein
MKDAAPLPAPADVGGMDRQRAQTMALHMALALSAPVAPARTQALRSSAAGLMETQEAELSPKSSRERDTIGMHLHASRMLL